MIIALPLPPESAAIQLLISWAVCLSIAGPAMLVGITGSGASGPTHPGTMMAPLFLSCGRYDFQSSYGIPVRKTADGCILIARSIAGASVDGSTSLNGTA